MTSWSVYHGINKQTRVMNNPMSQTMLFFGYLRGPKMHLWIKKISAKLDVTFEWNVLLDLSGWAVTKTDRKSVV